MNHSFKKGVSKRMVTLALLSVGSVFQFAVLGSCEDAFINATRFVDPCQTVFADCAVGSFFSNNVEIGSEAARCWDPTCTLPGQCTQNTVVPPIGTFRDPCN